MTENIAGREVTLPLYAGLTNDNVTYVVQAVRNAFLKGNNQ
jgi:dTDP-4-amino-4,6-dideoxygalactose transaminase